MSKISIIVPVYNTEKYLDKCLTSLINQTLKDIEIICIDDCSTDNSYNILKKYKKLDSRIKIIQNKKNSGPSVSRNLGIEKSTSPYLMFCDSDDWFEKDMCEKMLNLLIKNNAELAICSVNVVYENCKKIGSDDKAFSLPDGCYNRNDKQLQNVHNGSPLRIFKKDIIKKHNIKYPTKKKYEDIYFNKVYNLYTNKIATTSQKLYNYRRSASSITADIYSGKNNDASHYMDITILYFQYLKKHNFYDQEYYNFWTNNFISAAQYSLMFTKNKTSSEKLDKQLIDFIQKNYIFGTTNKYTDYIISLILDGAFMRYNKLFFGIITIYNNYEKKEYSLFKIGLFKIKYNNNKRKYYLFGIKIFERKGLI